MMAIHSPHVIHRKPNHLQRNKKKQQKTVERNRTSDGVLHRYKIRTRTSNNIGPCDSTDQYAPCRCLSFLTQINVAIRKGDRVVQVTINFVEYECAKKQKKTFKGYQCSQLIDHQGIYRDINNRPIGRAVEVTYNAGCELRCDSEDCRKLNVPPYSSSYNSDNHKKINDTRVIQMDDV